MKCDYVDIIVFVVSENEIMAMFYLRKKICLISLILIIFVYYLTITNHLISKIYYRIYPKKSIKCYRIEEPTLEDINEESIGDNSIFFHETSCNSYFNNNTIFLNARQACAVESAARLNPNRNIYVLFASPGTTYKSNNNTESNRIIKTLLSYDNIKMRRINYEQYTKHTLVEELYRTGEIDDSGWAQSHASDVLRYLTLWKYGGIYLDLDVIVIKSLEDLPRNLAGSESDRNIAAGILAFDKRNTGHQYAEKCLNDLKQNFQGSDWGNNGPGVITRLLRQLCGVDNAKDMVSKGNCGGFRVFPTYAFYPIRWQDWSMYFDENSLEVVKELTKNSYIVHVWNKHSVDYKIPISSNVAYTYFAKKFCPKVFEQCDEYF